MSDAKKIIIDCTSCCGRISGLERYTIELVNRIEPENYIIVLPKTSYGFVNIERFTKTYKSFTNNRLLNEWLFLPYISIISKCKIVFFPAFPPSIPFFFLNKKIVRTIHDVVMWKYPTTISLKTKLYTKNLDTIFVKFYNLIFTVSKNSAKEIKEIFPHIKPKIVNTYLGANFDIKIKENFQIKSLNYNDKFILSVGTLEPRKNYIFLLEVFNKVAELDKNIKLVIVGRFGWGYKEVESFLKNFSYRDRVILTGSVTDEELNYFYKKCELFVYPSLYEGFGLPVLEAIFHKKLVIASNRASIPEVVGKAGILLDIEEKDKWVEVILFYLKNPQEQKEITLNCFDQMKKFEWENVSNVIHSELQLL